MSLQYDKCKRHIRVNFLKEGVSLCMDCVGARLINDPRSAGTKHWDIIDEGDMNDGSTN